MLARIDAAGGTLQAIEQGLIQREIQDAAYRAQQRIDAGEAVVVGVNRYQTAAATPIDVLRIDPRLEQQHRERVAAVRASRDRERWQSAIDAVVAAAESGTNLVPPIVAAVEALATVGEISDAMRRVFGEHEEIDV